MIWMDRTASRWLSFSAAFATWCAGSVWVLLETTRSYPGIITMKPGRGAFELSEAALHMPAWRTLACLFLLAFLAMAVVGGLRRLMDPDRLAINAVFWVLRSKSLWLVLIGAVVLTIVGFVIPSGSHDDMVAVIVMAALILMLLTPFVGWNATTLRRRELLAWWRLRWPGWNALFLVLMLISGGLAIDATFYVFDVFGKGWITDPWVAGLRACLSEIVSLLAWLLIAVVWIERTTISIGWHSFLGFLRWRRLRTILWQSVLTMVVGSGVVIPILMATVLLVYVVPQYEELAKSGGAPLSWFLRAISQLALPSSYWWFPLAAVGGLWTSLGQGRLLILLGAVEGKLPQAIDPIGG